ncbi:MAG: MBL fold metallo-hydrolase [Deferrisomatales bacterium]
MAASVRLPPARSFALHFCALASGSKGNALFVGRRGRGVLVDAGLSGRRLTERLAARGLAPAGIRAVVVTHEHRDHVSGVGVWARRYRVPVYLAEGCRAAAEGVLGADGLRGVDVREFALGRPFEAGGLEFLPFSTSHDAACSVGFRVSDGAAVAGIAADLGHVTGLVRHSLAGAHLLYLEANHDEDLLVNGPYPWFLKQRVRSRHGHLSNDACAALVDELLHDRLTAVVLGHLSETNNRPRLAYGSVAQVLRARGAADDVTLLVARQDRSGRVVAVRRP